MFKFDDDERKTRLTKKEMFIEYFSVTLVFINVNYAFVAICLSSIESFSIGVFGILMFLIDFLFGIKRFIGNCFKDNSNPPMSVY